LVANVVYVGSKSNKLFAVSVLTGAELWSFNVGDDIKAAPVLGATGTVYVGAKNGRFYAVKEGSEVWRFNTGDDINGNGAYNAVDNLVYVASKTGYIYALNATDGSQIWSYDTDDEIDAGVAYGDEQGHVYVGNEDGYLFALDCRTGSLVWKLNSYDDIKCTPTISNDKYSTVYLASDNFVYAINASNGFLFWEFDAEEDVESSVALSASGVRVFLGSKEGVMTALTTTYDANVWSRYTGAEALWEYDTGDKVRGRVDENK
jgi:outer membrane protein assembly factor BamB